jgi:hypothetical protein
VVESPTGPRPLGDFLVDLTQLRTQAQMRLLDSPVAYIAVMPDDMLAMGPRESERAVTRGTYRRSNAGRATRAKALGAGWLTATDRATRTGAWVVDGREAVGRAALDLDEEDRLDAGGRRPCLSDRGAWGRPEEGSVLHSSRRDEESRSEGVHGPRSSGRDAGGRPTGGLLVEPLGPGTRESSDGRLRR